MRWMEKKNFRWDVVEKINRKKGKIKFLMEGAISEKRLVCPVYCRNRLYHMLVGINSNPY